MKKEKKNNIKPAPNLERPKKINTQKALPEHNIIHNTKIINPRIGNQFISMSRDCLELKNLNIDTGVELGPIFALFFIIMFMTMITIIYHEHTSYPHQNISSNIIIYLSSLILPLLSYCLLISNIKNINLSSNIVFNRKTKNIYVYSKGHKYISSINNVVFTGGSSTYIVFSSFNNSSQNNPCQIEIDNHWNFQEIVPYIKNFMHNGPDGLPIPETCEWDYRMKKQIFFTPMEALHHYAPWPFCRWPNDEGEKTMKIYLWPLYVVLLFPYYVISSLLWWGICRLANVHSHSVPAEAYEGDDSIRVTPEIAQMGVRP